MAKSKDNPDDITFMGQQVDPELQKKVDEYMEGEGTPVTDEEPKIVIEPTEDAPSDAGSAPLLPSDKLPININIKDGSEESTETPESEEATDSKSDDSEETEAESEETDKKEESEEVIEPEADDEEKDEEVVEEETPEEPVEPEETEDSEEAEEPNADATEHTEEVEEPEPEEDKHLDSEMINMNKDADPDMTSAPEFEDEELDKSKTIGEMADKEPVAMDDKGLEQAIDDIVAEDADKVLEIEDEKAEKETAKKQESKKAKSEGKSNFFKTWWSVPLYRNLTILAVIAGIVAAFVLPSSRYFLLNTFGVRVSTSVTVLDDKTSLPLKNVEFIVDGKSSKTDEQGVARVEHVKIGPQEVTIRKLAFADITKTITLGWGSNPLGEQRLIPTGTQYTFIAKDYVSEKPVKNIEASLGDATANFNDKGEAVLTIPTINSDELEVTIKGDNYREEKIKIKASKKESTEVKMVLAQKQVFVSKRSGKFDLYKSDIDGKNQEVVMEATGIENEQSLSVSMHSTKPFVAFASTRKNVRNKDNFLLTTLNVINLDSNEVKEVTISERIQLIDWSGNRLVYVKITDGASAENPDRHKLMSYDIDTGSEIELASTNYFNDVVSVGGVIYYSPSSFKINGNVGLYKVNADGSNKQTVYSKEVWNIFRTAFDKLSVAVGQEWYEVNIDNNEVKKVGGAPSTLKSRVYINSPDGKKSLWVDERDGKSVLLSYDIEKKADQSLLNENGIKYPIRWVDNDHIVYRISNSSETADYVMSLSSGSPKKIADVTDTVGVDRWYYF